MTNSPETKLGLHIPLLTASLVTMFLGTPMMGLIGVWAFTMAGVPVPYFLKISHAHVSWWAMVLLISALIMPGLPLKLTAKRVITAGAFLILPLYGLALALHYRAEAAKLSVLLIGELHVTAYGFTAFVLKVAFFAIMLWLSLTAAGIRFPKILLSTGTSPSRYEFISGIGIPGKAFSVYSIFLLLAMIIGLYNLFFLTLQYKPITPAALVRFHTHIALFSVGFLMTVIAMRAVGAAFSWWQRTFNLGVVALTATALGLLTFILFNTHSIVWTLPAMLHFGVLLMGWLSLLGAFGLHAAPDSYFHYMRWSLIVIWGALLIFTLAGPYLAIQYTTGSDLTVTYKQLDGGIKGKHVGAHPDPQEWQGTAPVKGTPRGVENFHLSPGSWSHVAIFWLVILMLFGKPIFQIINAPNLVFALAGLVVMAPIANAVSRITAWAGFPAGEGPLLYIAHPLKTINVLALIIILIILMVKLSREKPVQ